MSKSLVSTFVFVYISQKSKILDSLILKFTTLLNGLFNDWYGSDAECRVL